MEHIATLKFTDLDSQDEAHAIVRASQGHVGLALTLKTDGDLAVFMDPATCRELVDALTQAERFAN